MRRVLIWPLLVALACLTAGLLAFLPAATTPGESRTLIPSSADQTEEERIAALKRLSPQEIDALSTRETSAFFANPISSEALVNLTLLAGLKGDKAKEQRLALALADYARRSVRSQLAAIQILLEGKDYAQAFERIDGVVRARRELSDQFFPSLSNLVSDAGARKELARLLKADPPWRWDFMRHVTTLPDKGARAYQLFSEMRKQSSPVSDFEKRLLLSRMVSEKLFDGAYFMWLDLLDPADLSRVRNVFDGTFTVPPRQHFFDWNTPARKNARVAVVRRPGNSQDQSLELDLLADKDGGQFAYQLLRLVPESYSAEFEYQASDLKTPAGLVWRVTCVESGAFLGESKAIKEDGPWNKLFFDFEVPAEGCATQNLSLQLRSSAALDQEISGRILFDNIVIGLRSESAVSGNSQDVGEGGQQQ